MLDIPFQSQFDQQHLLVGRLQMYMWCPSEQEELQVCTESVLESHPKGQQLPPMSYIVCSTDIGINDQSCRNVYL